MNEKYPYLDVYSDWFDAMRAQCNPYPLAKPGPQTQRLVREALGLCGGPERPADVQIEQRWERDGLAGEAVSWSVGYGPRTQAWVLKPADSDGPLPGIVALHDHGGFKFCGKDKIADGPADPPPFLVDFRHTYYGGRAFANALAREGFVVLIHDTFLWGSRRFPPEAISPEIRNTARIMTTIDSIWASDDHTPYEVREYNAMTSNHEHWVEKHCQVLGTTMAGVVSHEDRTALNYLRSRADVMAGQVGCIGLSGGGNRAALLQATVDDLKAAVIVGLMCTYEGILALEYGAAHHTWMLYPCGWARYGDWPDLAACRAPSPLLVQYDLDDGLFTVEGMRAADRRIAQHYADAGHPEAYTGQFYPGPHKFDLEMQAAAFAWLKQQLAR